MSQFFFITLIKNDGAANYVWQGREREGWALEKKYDPLFFLMFYHLWRFLETVFPNLYFTNILQTRFLSVIVTALYFDHKWAQNNTIKCPISILQFHNRELGGEWILKLDWKMMILVAVGKAGVGSSNSEGKTYRGSR